MNETCKLKHIEEKLCVQCLICGEPVELDEMESLALLHPRTTCVKVCEKCRNAVKFAKSAMMNIDVTNIPTTKDTIAQPKDYKAVEPKNVRKSSSHAYSGLLLGYCPKCGIKINSSDNLSACGKCGQRVKWNA